MTRVDVLGVGFDPVTPAEAADAALALMERRGAYVCTPNPEIVMKARQDPAVMDAVNGADLVLADGTGVVWAARRFGTPLPGRVPGYDLLLGLLGRMSGSVYLLGGRPGVAEEAAAAVEARFPNVTVTGARDGYFDDETALLAELREKKPDLLAVCLGGGKQELWMAAHRELPVGLMAGLGGSLDVLSGRTKLAPDAWRRAGLEWLWRALRQPSRLKRHTALVRFARLVLLRKEQ